MYIFGDVHSASRTAESDRIAMSASDAELPALCKKGNILACQLAKLPIPTAEKKADMAAQREAQATADRSATAKRLLQVGVNPRIADAVKKGKPLIYAKDKEDAKRIIRKNFNPKEAQEMIDDFIDRLKPWYKRPLGLAAITTAVVSAGIFIFTRI